MIFRLLLACWVSVIGIAIHPLPSRADVAGSLVIAGNGPENNTIETLARAFEKANPRVYIDILWEDHSKPVEMVKCETVDLEVPAEAEIVLEGYVELGELRREGPFGDHYGYYSLQHDYPVFDVTQIAHRKDAIYPATVVGKPRQEDFYIGDLLQELLSPLFPLVMPAVEQLWSYGETGYHSLAGAVVKQRYARETKARTLGDAMVGADIFMGLSSAGVLKPEMVKAMAEHLPSHVHIRVEATPAGTKDDPDLVHHVVLNHLTPETERTTHYFWSITRRIRVDDNELSTRLHRMNKMAFDEDVGVLRDQQTMFDTDTTPLVNLAADRAVSEVRRIIRRKFAEEATA